MAICAGNSLVTGEIPAQRPVTWSFDFFFDLHLKWVSEWLNSTTFLGTADSEAWINIWVNNGEVGDLRHHHAHYDVIVMTNPSCQVICVFCAFGEWIVYACLLLSIFSQEINSIQGQVWNNIWPDLFIATFIILPMLIHSKPLTSITSNNWYPLTINYTLLQMVESIHSHSRWLCGEHSFKACANRGDGLL